MSVLNYKFLSLTVTEKLGFKVEKKANKCEIFHFSHKQMRMWDSNDMNDMHQIKVR